METFFMKINRVFNQPSRIDFKRLIVYNLVVDKEGIMTVYDIVRSMDYNTRITKLGSLTEMTGISLPTIGVIYPDKDIWFKDPDDSFKREPNNIYSNMVNSLTSPYTHSYFKKQSSLQSYLNSMDTQRISVALLGGQDSVGVWGFSESVRKKVLRETHSLVGILYYYVNTSLVEIPDIYHSKAQSLLDCNKDEVLFTDFLYTASTTSNATKYNDTSIHTLLSMSKEFYFMEASTILCLKDNLSMTEGISTMLEDDEIDSLNKLCDYNLFKVKESYKSLH
jgi:hypothetical protein